MTQPTHSLLPISGWSTGSRYLWSQYTSPNGCRQATSDVLRVWVDTTQVSHHLSLHLYHFLCYKQMRIQYKLGYVVVVVVQISLWCESDLHWLSA